MIRFELRRVLQEGAALLLVLVGLALAILFTRQDIYLAPALEIFLLLYASFTGWALLDRERQDGALETLLAMPAARLRLLGLKTLPRALFLAAVLAAYAGLHRWGNFPSYLPVTTLALLAVSLFLTALSFSVSLKSFFAAGAGSALLVLGLPFFLKRLDPLLSDTQAISRADLPLLLLPLVFAACFHRLDVRPVSRFNRRFVPAALLVVVATLAGLYVVHAFRWGCHFILDDGAVVRTACNSCRGSEWIRGDERRRFPGCLHLLRQFAGRDYAEWRVREADGWHSWLVRVDFAAGRVHKLYELDRSAGWGVGEGRFLESGALLGDTCYMPVQNYRSHEWRIVKITAAGASELPLRVSLPGRSAPFLFHVIDAPLRFLVERDYHIMMISATGAVQDLGQTISFSAWRERLLLVDHAGIRLYDLRGQPTPLWGRPGRARKLSVAWAPVVQPETLVRLGGQVLRVDLETAEVQPLALRISPNYFFSRAGRLWLVEAPQPGVLAFRRLDRDGRIGAERRQRITIRPYIFRAFPSGVVAFNESNYEAFTFPE